MRIAFIDPSPLSYTAETPYSRPLGGSQSAMAYLSAAIAALGHSVCLVTNTESPGVYRGVDCVNPRRIANPPQFLQSFDVLVILNKGGGVQSRQLMGIRAPLVLWVTNNVEFSGLEGLEDRDERRAWNGFAFVSEWQRGTFAKRFHLAGTKCKVVRNAIAPPFQHLAIEPPWYVSGAPPVLVYTSTPFRGLDVLLDAFPIIRSALPDVRLKVFSGMALYQEAETEFLDLYERARSTPGVEFVGAVDQTVLAREVAGAAALAYPSTYAETSCISVLEAMASGALVLTTQLGALPETTAGFASMVPFVEDKFSLAANFAAMTVAELRAVKANPAAALKRRAEQIAYVRNTFTWDARAQEWVAWLERVAKSARD